MTKHPKVGRFVALVVSGGCLLQLVGCATGLMPVALSFAESALLSGLLSGLAAP